MNKHVHNRILAGIISLILASGVVIPLDVVAQTPANKYPRLANYYLNPDITVAQAQKLARWDVVVLGAELQYAHPEIFPILRKKNPDITLLVYMPSEEVPLTHAAITDPNHPFYQLYRGIEESWWLTGADGKRFGSWPGTNMLNVTDSLPAANNMRWNQYLPQFIHDRIMSTGLWDGIFYDNVWPGIAWLNDGSIDINGDGADDAAETVDAAWRDGMAKLLARSRDLEGKDAIIIGNGGGQYYNSLNGRLIEDFPSTLDGGWDGAMQTYFDVLKQAYLPPYLILNGITATGTADDYQTLRYDLASALLGDGYFSFDKGAQEHAALWVYDEYETSLGAPQNNAYNVFRKKQKTFNAGVWRRDFTNGVVLVNSSTKARTVDLLDGFEKLIGSQVSSVNSGKIVTSVTLGAHDGIILLRRQFTLSEGQFFNGSYAQVFSAQGTKMRQGFFAYDDTIAGGADVIKSDLDEDGSMETLFSRGNKVFVFDAEGFLRATFSPFGASYPYGVNLAAGDLDGTGTQSIIVGAGTSGVPRVRVFSANGKPRSAEFLAYPRKFRGGVFVAAGDVNGDGKAEVITGAGAGGAPEVRVFRADGKPVSTFLAFSKTFRGGVSVASGDLNGDGMEEVIAGKASASNGRVRMLNMSGKSVLRGFSAFAKDFRGSARVSVTNVNQDLTDDILVFSPTAY